MENNGASNPEHEISSVEEVISSIKKKNAVCCKQQCIRRLLRENEKSLRIFLEEWLRLEKRQQEAILRFTIRLCSHWSERTIRGTDRVLSRFQFEDPILGPLCRKAFIMIIGIGDATLARHTAAVHTSSGRFVPPAHGNEGKEGHRQIDMLARQEVVSFLVEIASAVGEESPGRHRWRDEEEKADGDTENNNPVVFLPSMYSLRLLYDLYKEKIEVGNFPSECQVSLMTFSRIFHSKEFSWLRIRSPRDDVCDICLLYRGKMARLIRERGTKAILDKLGDVSSDFVRHRNLAMETRRVYRAECKKAREGAEKIQIAIENRANKNALEKFLSQYEAHYSFDFSQSLWLPQIADTPGKFYFLSLRTINLFGVVDDGGIGNPLQTNMLYDQTTAGKGSSEVVSMLYHFLTRTRNHFFAARRGYFHADNCGGQNKNCTVIQFFIWCIATGLFDHIELKFLLKGHTKFSPDGGFGMIKKHYRRANVYTIEQVAEAVKMSTRETKRNDAIILKKADFGDWKLALQKFFTPFKGISTFAVFTFDKKYPLGEVRVRKHEDDKIQKFNLLRPEFSPDTLLRNEAFVSLQDHVEPLQQPQMQAKKQWDLYEKVRPYVPVEYQDIICPKPTIAKKNSVSKRGTNDT